MAALPNDSSELPTVKRWAALILVVPRELGDTLAAELGALGQGVESRPLPAGREELRAFLRTEDQAKELSAWATHRLQGLGIDAAACELRVEEVQDGRWVERYQESLQPFPFGSRFTVHPRGHVEFDDGRVPLLLVPGRAFGTGEHATTQLCAEQLERCVRPGQHWLDLGCGSGILLLVAREFGVGRALGLEIDPAAVTTAAEVLRENGGHASIEVREGVLDDAPRGCWDGVICNISTVFLRMHLVDLAGLPQRGGLLILSGLLEEDLDEVAARLPAAGLRELGRDTRSPWAVLVAERD